MRAGYAVANHETRAGVQVDPPDQATRAGVQATVCQKLMVSVGLQATVCQELTVSVGLPEIEAAAAPVRLQWKVVAATVKKLPAQELSAEDPQAYLQQLSHNWSKNAGLRGARSCTGDRYG